MGRQSGPVGKAGDVWHVPFGWGAVGLRFRSEDYPNLEGRLLLDPAGHEVAAPGVLVIIVVGEAPRCCCCCCHAVLETDPRPSRW